jgi:phosphoglycolate phosphatase
MTIRILSSTDFTPGRVRFAVFDFDGTLSLLRAGWQDIMESYFCQVLDEADPATPPAEHESAARDFITRLTGRQTIYQALELERLVQATGATPLPAMQYKAEYLSRLHGHIEHRLRSLREQTCAPDEYLVRGTVDLLSALQEAGITCYLASGTDLPNVIEEAQLLGLTGFFVEDGAAPRIHGALPEYQSFSKRMVIERIITENHLSGDELVAFGDGFVEIEETRRAGGIAVGIASREDGGTGLDSWKAHRLQEVGAHMLVPDWCASEELLGILGISS